MDGVLADWDGMADLHGIKSAPQLFNGGESEELRKKIIKNRWQVIEKIERFWEDLEILPGTGDMLDIALKMGDLFILSKKPNARHFVNGEEYSKHIESAKINWVQEKFPDYFKRENIFIATGSKADFVGDVTGDILIDDLPRNIEDWNAAGGIGILYKSASQVIEALRSLKQ